MRASIDKINQLLNSKKTITITTHTNPDGDAIGSSFALYHYLLKLNHNVKVITPNKHPRKSIVYQNIKKTNLNLRKLNNWMDVNPRESIMISSILMKINFLISSFLAMLAFWIPSNTKSII